MASASRRLVAALGLVAMTSMTGAPAIATAPPTTEPDAPATTANPFLPEDENVDLSECISVVPRPECGSDERGGWRQGLVFGVVAVGMAAIGVRLAWALRRRSRQRT